MCRRKREEDVKNKSVGVGVNHGAAERTDAIPQMVIRCSQERIKRINGTGKNESGKAADFLFTRRELNPHGGDTS